MSPSNPQRRASDVKGRQRPNSLGIPQRLLESLLDRVDKAREEGQAPKRRRFVRWPFRQETLFLRVSHPGGSVAAVRVACRNLSHGGVSVLHSAFLYPGSRCAIAIPHPTKGDVSITGEIVRCHHIHRMIHEVGIKFDELLDSREFIPSEQRGGRFAIELLEPDDICGHIVCAGAASFDLRLIEHFLSNTRAIVSVAKSPSEAELCASRGCDLAIVSADLPGTGMHEFVRHIRRTAGHELPVVVVADQSHSAEPELRKARINALIIKPLTEQALFRALGEFLIHSSNKPQERSRAKGSDATARLKIFITELSLTIPKLSDAIDKDDAMGCYVLCQQLLGSAPAGGLKTIAKLADNASEQLATTMSLHASARQVKALIEACQHAVKRAA